ncbi:MAG TPA: tripartite tricarboxylate transporter substrate binding protein [Burkholderiales bacterium]|nr:tripartite tricarboxylate transporter substrate binding protein [Burkholderiales bacterium]
MKRFVAALLLALFGLPAVGQSWPAKPVRILVPFAPGGTADTLGRLAAQKLSDAFKESFVVENRPGAGGTIASDAVSRVSPDGYTLVVSGVASHAVAPALPSGVPYDPVKGFTHIALFGGPPAVLVVHPDVPARSLQELIQLLKAEPQKYSYGSPGNGTHGQLVAELFKQLAGVQMQHVPYKGGAAAMGDLIAGHVPIASNTLTSAASHIHSGKARALAVSSTSRLPDYPDVPTYAELGYQDLVATIWFGLSGPPGMPADLVERINAEVRRGLDAPDARARLKPEAIEPGRLSAKEFGEFVAAEAQRWAPVVRASGARRD